MNLFISEYRRTLEDDLINDLSGNFKRLMISLCCGNRDESGYTDPAAAQREASELLRAGEWMVGTDESTFHRVLCKTGFPQLKLVRKSIYITFECSNLSDLPFCIYRFARSIKKYVDTR